MDNDELFWGSRVVFFGEADHGKSSLIGYLFSRSGDVDMDRHEAELREDLGKYYKNDYLYSSLVHPFVLDVADSNMRYRTRKYHLRDLVIHGDYPIIITLIDTPGQLGVRYKRARSNQEYGISKGKIGVFCLEITHLLDDNCSDVFSRIKPWFAFHKNQRIIIALTQMDRVDFGEDAYNKAVKKIHRFIKEDKVAAIVPVAIDFKKRQGCNIFTLGEQTPWYTGRSLIDNIIERNYEIANNTFIGNLPNDLVFSINNEIPYPHSNAGKVWKIIVENGYMQPGQRVLLTSIQNPSVSSVVKEQPSSAVATVKEVRMDVKLNEESDEQDTAYTGASISINLKDCYIDGTKSAKRDINTTPQTVGLAADCSYELYSELFIRFDNEEDLLHLRSNRQEISVFTFGRGTPAQVVEFPEDLSGVMIRTLPGKYITIPSAFDKEGRPTRLRELGIFRNVVIRVPGSNNEFDYLPAYIDYDMCGKQ